MSSAKSDRPGGHQVPHHYGALQGSGSDKYPVPYHDEILQGRRSSKYHAPYQKGILQGRGSGRYRAPYQNEILQGSGSDKYPVSSHGNVWRWIGRIVSRDSCRIVHQTELVVLILCYSNLVHGISSCHGECAELFSSWYFCCFLQLHKTGGDSHVCVNAVADLRGGARDARPHPGPTFLHFHAVFGKNWPNNRLALPPSGVSAPSSGKSWICHCNDPSGATILLQISFSLEQLAFLEKFIEQFSFREREGTESTEINSKFTEGKLIGVVPNNCRWTHYWDCET